MVIVVPNTLQGNAKPLGRSVMVVANLTISSQCADPGIDLSLKAKGTLTICMLPTNLMVVSRIRIKAKIDLIHDFYEVNNQDNFEFDYEQDSITIVFNMQYRNKNVMFDEISSQPSLQCALTDLHVSDGSNGRTFHFKVDTGACGNLLPYNLYKQIAGHKAQMNYLHCTIDNSVNLVAYNNKKIKQLGICTLLCLLWPKHKNGEIFCS